MTISSTKHAPKPKDHAASTRTPSQWAPYVPRRQTSMGNTSKHIYKHKILHLFLVILFDTCFFSLPMSDPLPSWIILCQVRGLLVFFYVGLGSSHALYSSSLSTTKHNIVIHLTLTIHDIHQVSYPQNEQPWEKVQYPTSWQGPKLRSRTGCIWNQFRRTIKGCRRNARSDSCSAHHIFFIKVRSEFVLSKNPLVYHHFPINLNGHSGVIILHFQTHPSQFIPLYEDGILGSKLVGSLEHSWAPKHHNGMGFDTTKKHQGTMNCSALRSTRSPSGEIQ